MQFAEERAVVSQVEGSFVYLKTQSKKGCGSCSSKMACGNTSSIFILKPRNKLKLNNSLGLKVGDSVMLGMPTDKLLQATLFMYVLPIVFLFVFAVIAKFSFGEVASILAGLAGLLMGLVLIKVMSKHGAINDRFEPKLLRKIITVDAV